MGAQGYHLRTNYAMSSSATSAGGTKRLKADQQKSGVSTAMLIAVARQKQNSTGFSQAGAVSGGGGTAMRIQ